MRNRTRKSNSRKRKGGKAIASGGFGCVFKPALKCKGKPRGTGITKVLINRYAQQEIDELNKIAPILRRIPNKDNYFIGVDATTCELDPLGAEDKVNFDAKCNNLSGYGIYASNVNSNLSKISGIDLEYGGLDIENYLIKNKLSPENFVKLNNALINLLEKAIVPMNKLGLFHNDLKANNILVNDAFQTKIIDWGLSATQRGTNMPDIYKTRPFQFNIPFTICLFHPSFNNFLRNHVRTMKPLMEPLVTNIFQDREQVKIIMIDWINTFKTTYGGVGHYDYWTYLLETILLIDSRHFPSPYVLDNKQKIIEYSYLTNYIAEGLTEAVINYTSVDSGDFNSNAYFNDVYKHNVDVWGLLSVYFADIANFIAGNKRLHNNSLTKEENYTLLSYIKVITSKYIFNPKQQANAINISDLIDDLTKLNNVFPAIAPVAAPARGPSPVIVLSSPSPAPVVAPVVAPVASPGPKKTRKKHVVCDDAKKALCRSKGKVCNEATGRCNNP